MGSPLSSGRFPAAFAVAATCGVCAGLMDRGLPFFEQRLAAWAALVIGAGGTLGMLVGAAKPHRQPMFFVFLFLSGGIAALTSGYALVAGSPSIFEIVVLISIIGFPASLFFRSVHLKERGQSTNSKPEKGAWVGIFLYLIATLGLSWALVLSIPRVAQNPELPASFRLLLAAASYAAFMGWQPLVAVYIARWWEHSRGDNWLNLPRPTYFLLAALAPLCISGVAIAVAYFLGFSNDLTSAEGSETAERQWTNISVTVAATCGGLCLLWIQALAEEVGWRGYFLDGLMSRMGPMVGLIVHGVLWGVWYAPLLIFANGALASTGSSYVTFLVTCILLGFLLGWLRLASHSVISSALANGTLTVCAGLPFLLEGEDPGIQAVVYGPPGWIPMGAALVFIVVTKYRAAISQPIPIPERGSFWLLLRHEPAPEDEPTSKKNRPLH